MHTKTFHFSKSTFKSLYCGWAFFAWYLCTYTYSCLIGKLIVLGNLLLCVTKIHSLAWFPVFCINQCVAFQLDGDLELDRECSWEDFLEDFRSKCLLMDWILQGFQTTVLVTNKVPLKPEWWPELCFDKHFSACNIWHCMLQKLSLRKWPAKIVFDFTSIAVHPYDLLC